MIGGRSGSGKSNLVNIIIQNLVYFYSPEEIELYLLDYKEGVEFNSYTNPMLNHASLIAVNSNVSYGVTFLEYIIEEKDRRSELFKKVGKLMYINQPYWFFNEDNKIEAIYDYVNQTLFTDNREYLNF